MEQCPSKFSFNKDETLDHLQEVWPKLGNYITDIGDECDALKKELSEEESDNRRLQEEIEDLLNKIKIMETQITSLQNTQHSSDQPMTVTSPTNTYSSDNVPHLLASPEKVTYSRKCSRKLDENSSFRNKVLMHYEQPNHWLFHMDDIEGYFLEEDIDIAAWLSKIAPDIPCPTFIHQMKVVFGSCLNFEMVFSGFETNSLLPNHQATRWITDSSTSLRVGSQIRKGCNNDSQVPASVKLLTGAEFLTLILKHCSLSKEQIYTQIIPYMERDDEKRPYSTAGMEHTAYMQLHQRAPAPNKGKRPLTGSLQSRLTAHNPQPAKTGESSQQQLDLELDAYHQSCELALPYEEELPHSAPDVEMSAPVITGASSTLYDESTMNIDHELDDLYD
ncbi:hypothetical protein M422DRAFT_243699 [Sphaerobolus stellatus SS14]|nr:hypothetical protein M422DRAFT_243699 [Sphaerobolus stellatus SS14]